jgi:hypothetical protein
MLAFNVQSTTGKVDGAVGLVRGVGMILLVGPDRKHDKPSALHVKPLAHMTRQAALLLLGRGTWTGLLGTGTGTGTCIDRGDNTGAEGTGTGIATGPVGVVLAVRKHDMPSALQEKPRAQMTRQALVVGTGILATGDGRGAGPVGLGGRGAGGVGVPPGPT